MNDRVAILISLCSRNQSWNNIGDIDFFRYFLPGFLETMSHDVDYGIYLGFDDNDEFFLKHKEYLEQRLYTNDKVILLPHQQTNSNPCEAWNILARKARDDGYEYFYQCGSDIYHIVNGWTRYFINILKQNKNIGICGGVDKMFWLDRVKRDMVGIIENGFFHKTHLDIIGGVFNKQLKNWFSDDYISGIYYNNNRCFIQPMLLYRNTNRVGQQDGVDRYKPDTKMKDTYKKLIEEDSKKISLYIKNNS